MSLVPLPPLNSWYTVLKTLESLKSPTCCVFLYANWILRGVCASIQGAKPVTGEFIPKALPLCLWGGGCAGHQFLIHQSCLCNEFLTKHQEYHLEILPDTEIGVTESTGTLSSFSYNIPVSHGYTIL